MHQAIGIIVLMLSAVSVVLFVLWPSSQKQPAPLREVKVHAPGGIHSDAWTDFNLGRMPEESTIYDVFRELGKRFLSGYHYWNVRFAHRGLPLPFATKLAELCNKPSIVLEAFKLENCSEMPDEHWTPRL